MSIIIAVVGLLLFVCIALPLVLAWRVWRLNEATLANWLLKFIETAVLAGLIMVLGRWDIAGLWVRAALLGLLAVAALDSLRRHARRPWRVASEMSLWRSHGPLLASLSLFGAALAYVLAGGFLSQAPQAFAFPLEGGRFVVAQGGAIPMLNYHNSHRAQRHAADITAVDAAGFRATSLLPKDSTHYAIFGKAVISPCNGVVVAAVDGLPDLAPPTADRKNPAGNHVILACGNLHIELAHLRSGSVTVSAGARVATGEKIGHVGNSGNSTEPHLHVHAVDPRTGTGVQMSFDGVIPVRNRFFDR